MQWHMLPADAPAPKVDEFEKQALARVHLDLRGVPPRYRSSYFAHIWGGGYSAGYYAYLWTQMLDDDAYAWFDEHGGLTRKTATGSAGWFYPGATPRTWRRCISRGGVGPPTIDAMMKYRELTPPAAPR